VQAGDTYYQLSRRYQVPIDSLQRWNGQVLKAGVAIRVMPLEPNKTTAVTPTAAKPAIETEAGSGGAEQPFPSNSLKNRRESYAPARKAAQRVLVIPFDPYLYFSDADNDIARQSNIPKQNVRYVFRTRLNAFLDPPGFESINLLGGVWRDSVSELNRIYKSLTYSYQDIKYSRFSPLPPAPEKGWQAWLKHTKEKVGLQKTEKPLGVAQDDRKYYGVQVKDSAFFTYFNQQYALDYYLFINQFEIFTDYTNCIDRTTQNFERNFRVHYTIYDHNGELLAGNKVLIPYVSNVNDINKIVRENLNKMATRILADLPKAEPVNEPDPAN
jgi:hypothetical protein